MRYNYIQKLLSAAMLLTFTATQSAIANTYDAYSSASSTPYTSALNLSTGVQLTTKNDKITLSLRDSDAKQVLRMFADKVGMNIVFHDSVSGKVTLDLVNMPINDAFNLVMQVTNLNYYKQGNTLIIVGKDAAENATFSKQEMMTFPVKYVSATKIADFLNKNVFGMKKAGLSSVDAATVNAATNEIIVFGMPSDAAIVQKVIEQFDREPLSRTFAVNHTTPAEMADMICNMLLPSRGVTGGEGSKGGMTGGAAGIVTGGAAASSSSSSSIKLGEGVVACTVSQTASSSTAPFEMQGLSVAYYTQRGTISVMGGSDSQLNMIEKFIKDNDVKQPQAYVEVSIVELNEAGSKEFNNNWSFQSPNWFVTFAGGTTTGGRPNIPVEGFKRYIAVQRPSGTDGKSMETVYEPISANGSAYISWQMSYLIENNKGRVLANPKLIISNGQESKIDLTEDYVEKVTSEFLSGSQWAANAIQRTYSIGKDQGIKIALTPFISPEGYVTMNVKPEYATLASQVRTPTNVSEDGQIVYELQATLLNRRNLDLKNIRVKDGETLVIGGLIRETETKSVQKIPVLGDLPVVGAAFRSTQTQKSKNELVIMITPKIIKDGDSIADTL